MGMFDWKYTASDIADWLDTQDEKHWQQHDEWLLRSQQAGDAHPVFVFAAWFNDRMATLPQRTSSMLAGGVWDVLRLGNDFDFNSPWGTAKGVFLNLTRVATIAGPISGAVGAGGRYAGVLATSKLQRIAGAVGPCSFVSINNVLSFMKGRPVQLFAVLEDIIAVAGKNSGIARETLLASEQVCAALAKFGVTWKRLGGMRNIDEVLAAAKTTDGPIIFSIEWDKGGKIARHALTAVKDASGSVRILDYVDQTAKAFKGFGSMAEMLAARPQWGGGFAKAVLRTDQPVVAFSSKYLQLLEFADGTYNFALPLAMGVKWLRGQSMDEKLFNIVRSIWRFLKSKLEDNAPLPPVPSTLPKPPDVAVAVPTAPDTGGLRLGVSPLPMQAASAPRIDWLTGVQYRLKFLGYYKGSVHGNNDAATKQAVRTFQKDWFSDPKEWDAIPGPVTQAMLYSALGW